MKANFSDDLCDRNCQNKAQETVEKYKGRNGQSKMKVKDKSEFGLRGELNLGPKKKGRNKFLYVTIELSGLVFAPVEGRYLVRCPYMVWNNKSW